MARMGIDQHHQIVSESGILDVGVAPTLPDYTLFKNLPGAGAQLAPRLPAFT
jgi:hypothetical protein